MLVYGCRCGGQLALLESSGVGVVALPCIAALPPAFIDFAISRRHADGVMLVGCAAGDCYHRLGVEWMEQRLAGQREDYLLAAMTQLRDNPGPGRDTIMAATLRGLSDADLGALAHHLATFKP